MHIFANFVIFDDFGPFLIGKMNILDHFWGPQTASSPKVTIYLPLSPWTLSGPVKNLLFWPNFASFWTPFEGPGWRLRLGPVQAAFGLEDLLWASQTHARDPKFWSFWPLFLLKKSIFVILPIRGQWKCHFDPILTPFWALLSPNFGTWPKCAYLYPLPGWTLEGPSGTLFWP